MLIKCQNKKCSWCGTPIFEETDDVIYVKMVCPRCHTFLRFIERRKVSKKHIIVKKDETWWNVFKETESHLRPAYILQRELTNLKADYAVLQIKNAAMKHIINEATVIITDALEKEGIFKHIPKWMKEK